MGRVLLFILFVIALNASEKNELEPFGLGLGEKLDKQIVIQGFDGGAIVNVKKPVGLFSQYIVATDEEGYIFRIFGIGTKYKNDDYCFSSKADYGKVEKILIKKYGVPSDSADRLVYDSIWTDAKYYKMSFVKNERYHYTSWENIVEFPDTRIELSESGDRDGCYIKLAYIDKILNDKNNEKKENTVEDSL